MAERRLIVNADDFGFAKDVNAGIVEAHKTGILTATTLMANGRAFDDAVRLSRENLSLDVGCHLVLIGGPSLANPHQRLPESLPQFIRAMTVGRIRPYTELKPQIEKILAAGIRPLHLDTHKHTHLWPTVLDAVARLSQEYEIPWVRRPFDLPLTGGTVPLGRRLLTRTVGALRTRVHRTLRHHRCRTTDHFAGFQITGRFRSAELVDLIRALPHGVTEFMCHPGHCTDELRESSTRLKDSREIELQALKAPEVRQALQEAGVKLSRYRDL